MLDKRLEETIAFLLVHGGVPFDCPWYRREEETYLKNSILATASWNRQSGIGYSAAVVGHSQRAPCCVSVWLHRRGLSEVELGPSGAAVTLVQILSAISTLINHAMATMNHAAKQKTLSQL